MEVDKSKFNFLKKSPEPLLKKTSFKEWLEDNSMEILIYVTIAILLFISVYLKEKVNRQKTFAINNIVHIIENKNLTPSFQKNYIDYLNNKSLVKSKKVDNTTTVIVENILSDEENIKSLTNIVKEKNMRVVEIAEIINPESFKKEIKLTIER